MASNSSQESYEGMITALRNFQNGVEESCSSMENAVADCIENMNQDPHAIERTNEINQNLMDKLDNKIDKVEQDVQKVLEIIDK